MNLERISEQKQLQNQNGDSEEEQVQFQYSASRLENKAKQIEPTTTPRRSIFIRFTQYDRFSKHGFSKLRGITRYQSTINEREETEIEISSMFAWFLLLMSVLASSLVPCWLMSNLSKEPHTRNSWRFLMITCLTLPLVAYEKRRIQAVGGNIFSLITGDLLRQNYIIAVNFSIQYWFLIEGAGMTSLTHAVTLTSMKLFIISLIRFYRRKEHHEFVKAGIMLVVISVVLMMSDSFLTSYSQTSSSINHSRYWRLFGDIFCLSGSVCSALLYQKYQLQFPEEPRFLNLFFQNLFICLNYVSFGYYFGGSELSFNEFYGVFGLFNGGNFVTIFYVGIMLGFNIMLTNITLYQIYSPFILQISEQFIPLVTALLYHIMTLEIVPAYTYLSFGFFVPGMILILSGENALKDGEVRMNFVVYKPQNLVVGSPELTANQDKGDSVPSLPSRDRVPNQVQMQDWNKVKVNRKVSYDLSPKKQINSEKSDDRNVSM